LYSLLVLRTVHDGSNGAEFVPQIAVLTALLLAVISVTVLIYFIHHIPESINISNIVAGVGKELLGCIDGQFPSRVGTPSRETPVQLREIPAHLTERTLIKANQSGYMQIVDADSLVEVARDEDLILVLKQQPGDFVTPGTTYLIALSATALSKEVIGEIRSAFVLGNQRTRTQDIRFHIDQLVEVAMRAISPGINDPFTAMNCMDWLQTGLEEFSKRDRPDEYRFDEAKNLRLVAEPISYEALLALVFDQLRPYTTVDANAARHMMDMLARLILETSNVSQRKLLFHHAKMLRRECCRRLEDRAVLSEILERYRYIIWMLRDAQYCDRVTRAGEWVKNRR
ncbi:MAG: DUF2254 domain-containing protein, partial [Candidatus Eisenbacteria bacterium]|nr:DUF2254 domain-containing protein [Candidatus Eisenbacteria bacterium]